MAVQESCQRSAGIHTLPIILRLTLPFFLLNLMDKYAIEFVSVDLFRSKEVMREFEIGIGDEVYFPGLARFRT